MPRDCAAAARAAADLSARSAGVVVRTLRKPSEVKAAEELFGGIWQATPGHPPVSADLMRSLGFFGGYVAGAYTGAQLIGACVGFLGTDGGIGTVPYLHSHITGVAPHVHGRGIGYALKCDQRAWALERGVATVNWTFDPLVRRNAYFNLARLGAVATTYLVDFYGEMADGLNAGQGSDRLVAVWSAAARPHPPLSEDDVASLVAAGRVLLDVDAAGAPQAGDPAGTGPLLCRVAADIEGLRSRDAGLARHWRVAVRESLHPVVADGYHVVSATRSGWYVLARP